MRYFRNPNFISFCFLILIKPGCISGIPALGILDTLLNMIRIMLVLFTLIVLFKNAQLLPVNRLFGVTMLVVASILWEPISTLTGGGSIADFGALMNDLGIALVCYIGLRAGYDSFIEGVAKVSGAYVLINCLTVILFPAGMYATTKYSHEKGYHLEFKVPFRNLANDLLTLLCEIEECNLTPKSVTRQGYFIVYFKDSEQIADFLAYIGAYSSSMNIINTKITKQVKNNAVRKVNSEIHNINKTAAL